MGEVISIGSRGPCKNKAVIGYDPAAGRDATAFTWVKDGKATHVTIEASPVRLAARAGATQRMAVARLTSAQKLEARLLAGTMLANNPNWRQMWQAKADQVALSVKSKVERRPALQLPPSRSLLDWLTFGFVIALAIQVTPAQWFGL